MQMSAFVFGVRPDNIGANVCQRQVLSEDCEGRLPHHLQAVRSPARALLQVWKEGRNHYSVSDIRLWERALCSVLHTQCTVACSQCSPVSD